MQVRALGRCIPLNWSRVVLITTASVGERTSLELAYGKLVLKHVGSALSKSIIPVISRINDILLKKNINFI